MLYICVHYASSILNPIFNITFIVCLVQSTIHIDAKVLVDLIKHRQADPAMEESPISSGGKKHFWNGSRKEDVLIHKSFMLFPHSYEGILHR